MGKRVEEDTIKRIFALKSQGLTHRIIAIRTGLNKDTIRKIIRKYKQSYEGKIAQ